jgi:hypothetical protein
MSSDKGFYNSIEEKARAKSPKHHHHVHNASGDVELSAHDCEMKDDDATWAGTKMKVLDTITANRSSTNMFESTDTSKNYQFAVNASWVVNWFLLGKASISRTIVCNGTLMMENCIRTLCFRREAVRGDYQFVQGRYGGAGGLRGRHSFPGTVTPCIPISLCV